jgi:hypothetical protein
MMLSVTGPQVAAAIDTLNGPDKHRFSALMMESFTQLAGILCLRCIAQVIAATTTNH